LVCTLHLGGWLEVVNTTEFIGIYVKA
jgi:hypothetical protein